MSAATNAAQADPRTAGAQSLKRMFITLREAEDAAYDEDAGAPDPAQFASIIEAALADATSSGLVGYCDGFFAALAEWLLPTIGGCVIDDPRRWQPLTKERQSEEPGGSRRPLTPATRRRPLSPRPCASPLRRPSAFSRKSPALIHASRKNQPLPKKVG